MIARHDGPAELRPVEAFPEMKLLELGAVRAIPDASIPADVSWFASSGVRPVVSILEV